MKDASEQLLRTQSSTFSQKLTIGKVIVTLHTRDVSVPTPLTLLVSERFACGTYLPPGSPFLPHSWGLYAVIVVEEVLVDIEDTGPGEP